MTIREIEALSGVTRANIRFYESEGLLTPNRMENGYRDYTRSDLDTLHKIRLLRALGLGIDEIRKLSAGETALGEALESRLSAMQTEQRTLVRAEEVARAMLRAHADYATLDTGRYLAALEAGAQTAVQQDVQPKLHVLWRRSCLPRASAAPSRPSARAIAVRSPSRSSRLTLTAAHHSSARRMQEN